MHAVNIHVRKLESRLNEHTPRYWHSDDPFVPHFFNALSSTFPEGERFFIQSVRHFTQHGGLPADLAAQVDDFVGQEGQHSKEHDAHMGILVGQGYTVLATINRNQRAVMRWMNNHWPRFSLALTTAIEHITATFAHEIMRDPGPWLTGMHADMLPLWRWHVIEESEHKAVAFDVYQQAVGGIWIRRLAMLDATVGFLAEVFIRHSLLLIKDGQFTPRVLWRGSRVLFGKGGHLRRLTPHWTAFLRKDFHPWTYHDDERLLEQRKSDWGFA
jgi:predicted metal-dependent hydrolase